MSGTGRSQNQQQRNARTSQFRLQLGEAMNSAMVVPLTGLRKSNLTPVATHLNEMMIISSTEHDPVETIFDADVCMAMQGRHTNELAGGLSHFKGTLSRPTGSFEAVRLPQRWLQLGYTRNNMTHLLLPDLQTLISIMLPNLKHSVKMLALVFLDGEEETNYVGMYDTVAEIAMDVTLKLPGQRSSNAVKVYPLLDLMEDGAKHTDDAKYFCLNVFDAPTPTKAYIYVLSSEHTRMVREKVVKEMNVNRVSQAALQRRVMPHTRF
jgi:hypothetical protein